ncbi:unnamed protein product [Microthlaspi erraticum]|uniref:Uncharacterized protein n=1 Tax=Microthlaspi erraticum TaxID=1685480 RepID=A0A6D2I9U0_9BRAS|nr:unnamed protein product [Microthlaspi erraticum]
MDDDVTMKDAANDTLSVTELAVALPSSPGNEKVRRGWGEAREPSYEPWQQQEAVYESSYYDFETLSDPEDDVYQPYDRPPSPPPPGIIEVEETFYGRDKLLTSGSGQGNYYRTVILGAEDPTGNIKCKFLTRVHLAEENEGCFTVHTLDARKLPLDGFSQNWHHGPSSLWMPVWLPKNAVDKPQYYEMNDSDVQENKDWLLVYAELALYSWFGYGFRYLDALPLEVVKVFVQTTEDVEPAKAKNAIFYITFKTVAGREYNGIIKRATDGRPDRFSLEATCHRNDPRQRDLIPPIGGPGIDWVLHWSLGSTELIQLWHSLVLSESS